jgi:hypothetical protein
MTRRPERDLFSEVAWIAAAVLFTINAPMLALTVLVLVVGGGWLINRYEGGSK